MLQADAILEKMKNNGMMKEIVDSQETTLMITADQVCSLHILKRTLLYNLSWASYIIYVNTAANFHTVVIYNQSDWMRPTLSFLLHLSYIKSWICNHYTYEGSTFAIF